MAEAQKCPTCGNDLPEDSPGGHCPHCLLQLGLTTGGDTANTRSTIRIQLPPESLAEKPGDRIGRYKLLQQIGEGGCGVVYMADQSEPVRRRVALKVIKPGMDSRQVLARFEAERQALALMDHPNIAKVLDAGATETGRPYFVMELVKGIPITRYCDEKQLSTESRLNLFVLVCQAIQHAHQKGIIHRDIKPSNILVADHDGTPVPKIIDFGIAKATTDQRLTDKTLFTAFEQFIGTPAYMSPEQASLSGLDIDTRSDIYSLGVLLYELLTGKTPFDAKELLAKGLDEIRRVIREVEPQRPSTRLSTLDAVEQTTVAHQRQSEPPKLQGIIRGDLDWIVMKALEKDRTRRYETANGLAVDIQRHLNNEPVVARPPSNLYRFQKLVRRNKLIVAASAGVALALLLGIAVSTWQAVRATLAQQAANQERERAKAEAKRADLNAEGENRERKLAENFLEKLEIQRAQDLFSANDAPQAIAYLARILRNSPSNQVAAQRLLAALTQRSFALPIAGPFQHASPVYSASFNPDGRKIATASFDGTARIWDSETGQPVTPPLRHSGRVLGAEFSPDGLKLATASDDKTACIWDACTGELFFRLTNHTDLVRSAAFSPDSTKLVTVSDDGTARIWDVGTGQQSVPTLRHATLVYTAKFSSDGLKVVTASGDRTAKIWDTTSGQALHTLKHVMQVYSAQFAPGDARVVTASEDKTAIIWDVTTGKPLGRPLVHDGEVYRAEFSPDGLLVTTASWDSTARIWDARSSTQVTPPLKHNGLLYSASFSPDGLKVITASEDHTARIWDAHTGLLINHMRHDSEVRIAQFSSDGLKILTASFDGLACVWDGLPGCSLPLRLKHEEPVRFAVFGPDGKSIAAVNSDFSSTVWRIEGSSPRAWKIPEENLPHGDTSGGRVFNGNEEICFSPDGTRVARISVSKTVRIYNWEARRELTPPLVHGERIKTLCFSPSGDRLLTGCMDGVTRMWNSSDGHLIWEKRLGSSGGVFSATFNRDGSQVLASSLDGTASICDATSGKKLVELSGHGYDKAGWKGWVLFAQFSPDGRKVVTASRDTTARVWDVVTGKETMSPLKHRATVSWAEFSPDSRKVLTASWDQTARLWDASTGKPLTAEIQHSGPIFSAKFSPDGTLLVTSSGDKTARVWDADTGRAISEPLSHGDEVAYAAFSQDGQKILTASSDRTVKIWDSPLAPVPVAPWLPDLAEAIAGQSFGPQGISKPVSLTNLFEIKRQLASRRLSGPFSDWARWFFGNRSTRAISPYCSTTMPSYIEQCIFEGTRDSLEEAIRLSPTNSIALAELIVHRNEFPKSPTTVTMKRLRNAAEGGDVRSMNELAWRQATDSDPQFRDGQSAVRFAEKAVAMTNRKDPAYLDTLAAAYAEACNFTNAIAVQREAMELLKEDILKKDFESRLKLYEANTPYHTAD